MPPPSPTLAAATGLPATPLSLGPLLIVERDPELRRQFRRVLERHDWSCIDTDRADRARHLLRRTAEDYTLVILGDRLVDGEPWPVLRAARERRPPCPVLMVLPRDREDLAQACLERGAIDHLPRTTRCWSLLPAAVHRSLRIDAAASTASRLTAIITASPDAIITLDLEGTIQSWNPAAERLYGQRADQALGTGLSRWTPQAERVALVRACERAARGRRCTYATWRRHADGTEVPVHCAISPITDARHGAQALVVVEQDRRPRLDAERLAARSRELDSINRELGQFAAVAAHDLKAPLRVACLQLDLLAQQAAQRLDDDDRRLLTDAQETLRRSGGMIDRILEYAADGTVDPSKDERIDAAAACDDALDNLGAAIAETDAEIDRGPLPTVLCDRTHLMRIFQNLISNAIRYRHPERRPRITIAAHPHGEHYVAFEIRDNGCGIDPSVSDSLFLLFNRGDDTGAGGQRGSGIGLAVCRKMVEARGGSLGLSATSTAGSTFTFTLPRGDADSPTPVGNAALDG